MFVFFSVKSVIIKMNFLKLNFPSSSCLLLLTLKYSFSMPSSYICYHLLPPYAAKHVYFLSVICSMIFLCTCHILILWHKFLSFRYSHKFIFLSSLSLTIPLFFIFLPCHYRAILYYYMSLLHISRLISKSTRSNAYTLKKHVVP